MFVISLAFYKSRPQGGLELFGEGSCLHAISGGHYVHKGGPWEEQIPKSFWQDEDSTIW